VGVQPRFSLLQKKCPHTFRQRAKIIGEDYSFIIVNTGKAVLRLRKQNHKTKVNIDLHQAAASARSKSIIKSSICSMPTERRSMSSLTPAFDNSSAFN